MEKSESVSLFLPINRWNPEERPREKMNQKGRGALSNAELLAILLGTGSRRGSALDLARQLLARFGSVDALARAGLEELCSIPGIGMAKAVAVSAAFELGRRRESDLAATLRIRHSKQAADYLSPKLRDQDHEIFYLVLLNRHNEIIGEKVISSGGVNATVVDLRLIFREVFLSLASAILIAHNHTSGNHMPSNADERTTDKLSRACQAMGIILFDHLIISRSGYYSFADEGKIDVYTTAAEGGL